jgi:hypothetical protein
MGPETETARGWQYFVTIERAGEEPDEHQVTLSHHDYEHWCGGIEPPSRIAERGVWIAAGSLGRDLPARFDLSQIRRLVARFDERMNSGDD